MNHTWTNIKHIHETKTRIDIIEKSDHLVNFINDLDNNEFTYRMVFNNKEELRNFKSKIDKQNNSDKEIAMEERMIELEDLRSDMENEDKRQDAQRQMAWFALFGMLLYPFAVVIANLIGLDQASKILGNTGENPAVGCVIVKDGSLVSAGHTGLNGVPHAEYNAIKLGKNNVKNCNRFKILNGINKFFKWKFLFFNSRISRIYIIN